MLDNDERKRERDRLIRLYYELDDQYQRAKGRRTLITILAFSLFYLIIFFSFGEEIHLKDIIDNFWNFVSMVFCSLVLGGIHFWANLTIFSQIIYKSREENEHLKYIENRIRELEKRDSY